MDNNKQKLNFVRRLDYSDYVADQAIGAGGGTVTDVPLTPTDALEIDFNGQTYVVLAYTRKL